jgi:sec-independent protein translocase protein TatB
MALIGAVALIVIGPEKLPKVARMVGLMLGKAQRYVADVKAEVNRSMDLDELRKMKDNVESAARDVEQSMSNQAQAFDQTWAEATQGLDSSNSAYVPLDAPMPLYRHPGKKWRIKQGAVPQWYKAHHGVRTKALSGAARVARYRPKRIST